MRAAVTNATNGVAYTQMCFSQFRRLGVQIEALALWSEVVLLRLETSQQSWVAEEESEPQDATFIRACVPSGKAPRS